MNAVGSVPINISLFFFLKIRVYKNNLFSSSWHSPKQIVLLSALHDFSFSKLFVGS